MFTRLAALAAAFVTTLGLGAASAATLSERDMPGGAFGSLWNAPSAVGTGVDVIEGTGAQGAFDNFVLTLPSGAQRITFDFAAPEGVGYSYSAGGQILVSESAFRWGWDGRYAAPIQLDYNKRSQSFALDLADSFGGTLYLALNFTHGADIAYRVSIPSNAAPSPAPVPLPAGVWLIGTAAAALGGLRWTRRRSGPATA